MGDVRCNLFAILPHYERSIEIGEDATTPHDVYELFGKRNIGIHADSSCDHAVQGTTMR